VMVVSGGPDAGGPEPSRSCWDMAVDLET